MRQCPFHRPKAKTSENQMTLSFVCLKCLRFSEDCKCVQPITTKGKAKRAPIQYDIVLWGNGINTDVQSFSLQDWEACKVEWEEYQKEAIELDLDEDEYPYMTIYKYRDGQVDFDEYDIEMECLPKKVKSIISKIMNK